MTKPVNPFAALFQPPPARLPKTASQQIVHEGKRIAKSARIERKEDVDAAALRRERDRAYFQQRYQRERQNPEAMARRAWHEANKERVRAYKKAWDAAHADEQRQYKAEWAKRKYHASPEAAERARESSRAYYQRNREQILARLVAKAAAKKADGLNRGQQPLKTAEPAPAAPAPLPPAPRKPAPGENKSPWRKFQSLGQLSRKGDRS